MLAWVGLGAGLYRTTAFVRCSACQVLIYGELTVLVRCWFMGSSQCLSGAGLWGAHSACQVLVHGELTVLVRCWFIGSSQCLSGAAWCKSSQRLSGAGIDISPRCTVELARSGRVQCLSGTGMWQSVRCLSGIGNQGRSGPCKFPNFPSPRS